VALLGVGLALGLRRAALADVSVIRDGYGITPKG
jgi:hypothetical protein